MACLSIELNNSMTSFHQIDWLDITLAENQVNQLNSQL
jgi:hypothetical protein